ncbi:hypothetical protein MFIFM68171_11162 [Madurella fahalii]|uniref:Uncharacterized protein n=1 Tax=Madurella fahalii TaxID=1157608 RepID=A0ABQ0GTD2_9PEZI
MAPSVSILPESRAEECSFEDESDLYGLGIRLGVYMQWISALIIVGFRFKGDNSLSQSYTMFLFAVFLAVLVITARSDPTHVAEMLVLTYIIFGGSFVISGTREKNAPIRRFDLDTVSHVLNLSIMMCLLTAAAAYCAWFWLRGMYRGTFLETPCGTYGFLFAKVSLYDRRVTGFFAALSIVATISFGSVIAHLVLSVARVASPARRNQLRLFPRPALLNNTTGDSESGTWAENRLMKVARALKAGTLVYSILGIELTLHWNGITDVYDVATTGQLIPFTIGLCGLVKIIFTPLLEVRLSHPYKTYFFIES